MPASALSLDSHATLLALGAVLGLLVGSFLNVVICRLPQMMMRGWRQQCSDYLAEQNGEQVSSGKEEETYNLVKPLSHCPHCQRPIGALENIPLLSFIILRGRCKGCEKPISWRYPAVELLTGILTCLVVWRFGISLQTLGGCLLIWSMIALAFIDADTQLLPDNITLPLLWLGLLFNLQGLFSSLEAAVIGAIAGYTLLWCIYWLFKFATGKEGMGYGDFKLLAALGAWFGWSMLPGILLFSSLTGLLVGLYMMIRKRASRQTQLPFGPYLAAAGTMMLFFGDGLLAHLPGL